MIRLMGGLGNQMFQYAFGRNMTLANNAELVLDQSLLLDKSAPHEVATHRDYSLDIFPNVKFRWAAKDEIFDFNGDSSAAFTSKLKRKLKNIASPKKLLVQDKNKIEENYFTTGDNTCFVGRWQSYKFFDKHADVIKREFEFEKPSVKGLDEMLEKIKSSESVCLHIRRGDLVSSPLYSDIIGALDESYYLNAIKTMSEQVNPSSWFVFSDDIEWCKLHITVPGEITFVPDALSGYRASGHLYLMKNCRHFIISNSTFAWWAAYLSESKNKKVIYPMKWFRDKSLANPEMSPSDWTGL